MFVGISIYDNDFRRLTFSDGAILVNELNGLPCKKRTYIPKLPWFASNLINNELNESNYLLNVSIGKLNNHLIEQLRQLKIDECKSYGDLLKIQKSWEYKKLTQQIVKYLSKRNRDVIDMSQHKLYFCDKSLANNTFNKLDNEYLGMHLDSYEGQSLNNRNKARNRICINLGLQSRFLLFYRTNILEMARKLNHTSDNQDLNQIYENYMKSHLHEPIYRIEVKPYEYYIAPTEAIIHDGSNWPSHSPDINLVFRGRFSYSNFSTFTNLYNIFKSL